MITYNNEITADEVNYLRASIGFRQIHPEQVNAGLRGSAFIVVDDENNVALVKQAYVSNNYICVAGYVKQGETIESTAKREVEEETGLQVISAKYIKSYYYEKRDNLMFGFVCIVKHSEFNISGEVDKAEWFSLTEAEKLLRQGSVGQDLMRDYLEQLQ